MPRTFTEINVGLSNASLYVISIYGAYLETLVAAVLMQFVFVLVTFTV
jgi:hypothetical protein